MSLLGFGTILDNHPSFEALIYAIDVGRAPSDRDWETIRK